MDDDYRIELFIFPDGTQVEMIVFDRRGTGSASTAPASPAPAPSSPEPTPSVAPPEGPSPAAGTTPAATSPCRVDRAPAAPAATATVAVEAVSVCPVCHGDLVHPVDWRRTSEVAWLVRLRCPECETQRTVEMDRAQVERLNRDLYRGTQALAREAERISRRNFEEEAHRFVEALRTGLIQPIDF